MEGNRIALEHVDTKKVNVIVRKEWSEIFRHKYVMFSITLLPMLLVAIPLVMLFVTGNPDAKINGLDDIASAPGFAGMDPRAAVQVLLVQQFMFYFLMMPLLIPTYIASYSIIGEKQQRTLEPLLATPMTVTELLLGKALAALVPAVGVTWFSYAFYVVVARFLTSFEVWKHIVSPVWVGAILLLGPLLGILAITVAVMISSRVNDIRVAEQMSGMLVVPVVLLGIPLTAAKVLVSWPMFLIALAVILAVDVVLLLIAVRLFERETILTRWK
jgi:ABC-2 type transport system permease protein